MIREGGLCGTLDLGWKAKTKCSCRRRTMSGNTGDLARPTVI